MADEIYRLRELRQNALVENSEREGKNNESMKWQHVFKWQSCQLAEYDDLLVRRLTEKLTVLDYKLTVEFRLSAEIDVEI